MILTALETSVKRFLLETDLYARLTFKTLLRKFSRPYWTIRPFRYIVSPFHASVCPSRTRSLTICT
jgi:hypothetical protein